MKHIITTLYILILGFSATIVFSQNEFSPGDHNILRIENEIKLAVPDKLSSQLWDYLQTKYNNENLFLKKTDNAFNTKTASDVFIDQYYDNDDFQLLKFQNGVRHRKRIVLTDSLSSKNNKELMQIKINNISENDLSRGEYKYPIKHYKNAKDTYDTHPFLGIVKRKKRRLLVERIKQYNINAYELHPTIRVEQNRNRIYIFKDTLAFATITLDEVTSAYQDKSCKFTELELELNEILYTNSNGEERKKMELLNEEIKQDILTQFPDIVQDQTPKYNKSAIKMGLISSGLYSAVKISAFSLLLIAIIVFLLKKKNKKK
jgi:hypothetical protein